MQKKLLLPVAVLGLALVATACTTGPNGNNQGMNPTGQGYTTNPTGYNNTSSYNRVTNRTDYGYNPMNRTGVNRYSGSNWGTTGVGYNGTTGYTGNLGYTGYNGYNGYGQMGVTNPIGRNYGVGPNNGLTLGDMRNTNPNVTTPNVVGQADKIAKMATGVKGVDSAKSLVAGNTAYVGLDINSKVTRRNAARIEQEVHRIVTRALPGYDVRVTSDRALFQRTGTFFNNDVNNFNNWNRTTGTTNTR